MDNDHGVCLSVGLGAGPFEQNKEDLSGDQHAPERELVERMPEFLRDDRFLLVVQPVIELQSGKIIGAEVLSRLRWRRRDCTLNLTARSSENPAF